LPLLPMTLSPRSSKFLRMDPLSCSLLVHSVWWAHTAQELWCCQQVYQCVTPPQWRCQGQVDQCSQWGYAQQWKSYQSSLLRSVDCLHYQLRSLQQDCQRPRRLSMKG
jgi:hypothetical protein